jgi:mRNA guanylyltransferase
MFLTEEDQQERVYLITRKNEYYWVDFLHFPLNKDDMSSYHVGTLIDGELVKTNDGILLYLMFDCLALNRKSLLDRTFDKRLGYLREYLYQPYCELLQRFPQDCSQFPFKARFKNLQLSSHLDMVFEEMKKLNHVSDGLIFTSKNGPYIPGTDDKLLKWKPADENTVDFLLMLEFPTFTDPDIIGPEATYVVYDDKPKCQLQAWQGGAKHSPFAELYLTDEEWEKLKSLGEPLHERVVEAYKDDESRWRYMRFRDDKESGNHVSVVEKVLMSIDDSVSKEELLEEAPRIRSSWKQRNHRPNPDESQAKRRRISES